MNALGGKKRSPLDAGASVKEGERAKGDHKSAPLHSFDVTAEEGFLSVSVHMFYLFCYYFFEHLRVRSRRNPVDMCRYNCFALINAPTVAIE